MVISGIILVLTTRTLMCVRLDRSEAIPASTPAHTDAGVELLGLYAAARVRAFLTGVVSERNRTPIRSVLTGSSWYPDGEVVRSSQTVSNRLARYSLPSDSL